MVCLEVLRGLLVASKWGVIIALGDGDTVGANSAMIILGNNGIGQDKNHSKIISLHVL